MLFHRVVDDFVIQTGDPTGTGGGGSDEVIWLEIRPDLLHVDGAVGMARSSDFNSATSQFYICDGAQEDLNGRYAVFGQVIEGMDVVEKIESLKTDSQDRPVEDVVINRIELLKIDIAVDDDSIINNDKIIIEDDKKIEDVNDNNKNSGTESTDASSDKDNNQSGGVGTKMIFEE